MFNHMVKAPLAPPIGIEIGFWKVPLSILGDEFTDLIVHDAEDTVAQFGVNPGSAVTMPGGGVSQLNTEGPLDGSPMGNRNRPWAGEIGYEDAVVNAPDNSRAYAKYVSAATWKVGRTFYDLEFEDQGSSNQRIDDDLWQEEPRVADLIRGATYSGVTAGLGAADSAQFDPGLTPPAFADSISQWAERLSLMGNANQTYAEYLQGFGVDISRVGAIPEPVLYQRRVMLPGGTSQVVNGFDITQNVGAALFGDTGNFVQPLDGTVGGATGPMSLYGDAGGYRSMVQNFNIRRRRRVICDEPSILLGCVCWWPWMVKATQYAHIMDVTRMTHGSHWGNPTGGLDESEFLTAQELADPDGVFTQSDEDGQTGARAFNMLNLYLHGDSFTNDTSRFDYFFPGDSPIGTSFGPPVESRGVNVMLETKLAVATDLVG